MSHVETVKDVYEAMKLGDVASLRARLAADVVWEHGTDSVRMPWVPFRQGREAVAELFDRTSADDAHTFAPTTFYAAGNRVTARVTFTLRTRGSADVAPKVVSWQEVHQWQFNPDGKIDRIRQRSEAGAGARSTTAGKLLTFGHSG